MEDKKITEKESLQIIQQMITQSRRDVIEGKTFLRIGAPLSFCLVLFGTLCYSKLMGQTMVIVLWGFLVLYSLWLALSFKMKWLRFGSIDGASTYIEKMVYAIWKSAYVLSNVTLFCIGINLFYYHELHFLHFYLMFIAAFLVMAAIATDYLLQNNERFSIFGGLGFFTAMFDHLVVNSNSEIAYTRDFGKTAIFIGLLLLLIIVFPGNKLRTEADKQKEDLQTSAN